MGGCTSTSMREIITTKQHDYNENYTKQFEKGEHYYLFNKEENKAYTGDKSGGRNKIQLSLSVKLKNRPKLEEFKDLRIDFYLSQPNNPNEYILTGSAFPTDLDNVTGHLIVFDTNFTIEYYFEKHQYLKFEVFDQEVQIDTINFTLGRLMGSKSNTYEYFIKTLDEVNLIIKALSIKEEVKNSIVRLEVATNLFDLPYSDYFILLINLNNEDTEQKVWKSEEKTGKELVFEVNDIYLYDICLGDLDKEFIIDIYRVFYGHMCRIKTTINKLNSMSKQETLDLEGIQKGCKVGSCKVTFNFISSLRFVDYIEMGMQMSLAVGIDFTSSNGNPSSSKSLHYVHGKDPTNYEQAITCCGSIVAHYDLDGLFPVYGFGGVLPKGKYTNHCFNLNFKPNANVDGVDGVINVYKKGLSKIQLDGPTYFSPLIKNFISYVRIQNSKTISSVYYILLILTDGHIHDMQQTKDMIVEASKLPISIIIIGIGDDDFANMVELDGDQVAIKSKKGEKCERDIVQFVRFNEFKFDSLKLSELVLQEVPLQVEQFYRSNKIFRSFM